MDRVISISALALLALQAVLPGAAPLWVRVAAASLSVVLAVGSRPAARGLTTMIACLVLAMLAPLPAILGVFSWQARMILALLAWGVVARARPGVRASREWRARGSVPVIATIGVGGVTPIALGAWLLIMRPDLTDVAKAVPAVPLALLVVGASLFAIVNATLEELVWRGVIQDRLAPSFSPSAIITLQAASFGAQHMHGVPRGIVGVLLAGTWAVMLGVLRRHGQGLLAPVLAHVMADTTIAVIILVYVR